MEWKKRDREPRGRDVRGVLTGKGKRIRKRNGKQKRGKGKDSREKG